MTTPTAATAKAPAEGTVYNPSAETYERELVPAIFRSWATSLVELAGPRAGERVLDVACGTGVVARTAAARVGPGGTVAGVDLNPAMLAVARRASAQLRPPIQWEEASALSLPFDSASFDVVLCQQGLQFFADRELGLKELHRVTTPRGRVALCVWRGLDHHPFFSRFDEVLSRYLPAQVLEGSDAPFSLGDPEELRALARRAGFREITVTGRVEPVRFASAERVLAAIGGAHAPVAGAVGELDEPARRALHHDLTDALRSFADDEGLMYPMVASVVLARP